MRQARAQALAVTGGTTHALHLQIAHRGSAWLPLEEVVCVYTVIDDLKT